MPQRSPHLLPDRARHAGVQLLRFGSVQARSCAFAVVFFVGLVLTRAVELPVAPSDALLAWCLVATAALWWARVESGREVLVIVGFHLVGLVLELYKVRAGSWSYPADGLARVGDVPLYSGFMYAAVGSYVCQSWRRFDLRFTGYRQGWTALLAAGVYVNFFTSHHLPDARYLLAAGLLVVTWRARVWFTVGDARYRMPLAASFALIGTFLWGAENLATLLGAWSYPDQVDVWQVVHPGKALAWSLLVVVSIVLVATLKGALGELHGEAPAGELRGPDTRALPFVHAE